MSKPSPVLFLALALFAAMFSGCSKQEPALPTTPQQGVGTDFVAYDELVMPTAGIRDLLGPTAPLQAGPESVTSCKALLGGSSAEVIPTVALPVPLPKAKLVKEVAALAIAAVDGNTYWPLKTFFINDGEDLWGFQVAALEVSDLGGCDGFGYYCYYYMDQKVEPNANPVFDITPYSSAVSDAEDRVVKALRDPDTIINRTYVSDDYYYYMYTFDYPDGDGYRRFGMCKFNLCAPEELLTSPF